MKILNEQAFTKPTSSYVAMPLGMLKETADKLEGEYLHNRESYDQLDIALQNLEIDPENKWIKDEAITSLHETMKDIEGGDSFEHAGAKLRQATKSFATNQGLNAALKDKQNKEAQKAALQAQVGEGKITQEDYDYVTNLANQSYQGIAQDENGNWGGQWQVQQPPEYVDVGAYVDGFLEDFEEDEIFGRYIKKKDGWYLKPTETTPGGFELGHSTKKVSYEEVYQAARDQAMQNEQIAARVRFDAQKRMRPVEEVLAEDPDAFKAMKDDLSKLGGYEKDYLNKLSNKELMKIHTLENVIHGSISGAVSKHSYQRETFKSFGMSWEAKKRLEEAKVRAKKEKSELNDDSRRVILQSKGISMTNPFGIPQDSSGFVDLFDANNMTIEDTQKDIRKVTDELAELQSSLSLQGKSEAEIAQTPEVESLQRKIDDLTFQRQTAEFSNEEHQKFIDGVMKGLVEDGAISKDEYDAYYNQLALDDAEYEDSQRAVADAIEAYYDAGNMYGTTAREDLTYSEVRRPSGKIFTVNLGHGPQKTTSILPLVKDMQRKGLISDEDAEKYKEFHDGYNRSGSFSRVAKMLDDKIGEDVNNITVETTYFNIGLGANADKRSDFSNPSLFAEQVTHDFLNNKNGWTLVGSDGKMLYADKDARFRNEDITEIVPLGMTTESVGKYGYMVAANVKYTDDDGNEKEEFVYTFPSSGQLGSGVIEMARDELVKGSPKLAGGGSSKSAAPNSTQLARKLDKVLIDKHMSEFQNHTLAPNQTVTKKIPIGYDGKYAEVSRVTGSTLRNMEYKLKVYNEDGSIDSRVQENAAGDGFLHFNDQFTLEANLEHFTGVLFDERYAGTRAQRHNNPAAFTVNVAKQAGLVEGEDFEVGDAFNEGEENTANLLGNPIDTTIRVIDKIGLHTKNGTPRWSYLDKIGLTQEKWNNANLAEKEQFIREMEKIETGVN